MSVLGARITELREALEQLDGLAGPLEDAAQAVATSFRSGGKLLAAGNGGSAAEAQHLTGEMVGRLAPHRERGGLPAIALHADTSAMTAVGNDYGYERIFARQVEALGRPGDVLVVLSTSGASPNLVAAVDAASSAGIETIGLLGGGTRPLHQRCTHVLAVVAPTMQSVQECHLVLVHALSERIEDILAESGGLPGS